MSYTLKNFFKVVKSDNNLQLRLYKTNKISEVADIAKEYGFDITAMDVLKTQAGRILLLPVEEQQILAAGNKPNTGAQWGRNGKGYLDNTGYWLNQFITWRTILPANEPTMEQFIELAMNNQEVSMRLEQAYCCNDVMELANEYGFEFDGVFLLKYMASQVLTLNDEKLLKLVNSSDSFS